MNIFRGDILLADLNPFRGSEQGGTRPVVVVQNNIGNKFSPTIIVASITSKATKSQLPTHVNVKASYDGLVEDSIVMLEQMRTIDKTRIIHKLGEVSNSDLHQINCAISVSLGLNV